MNSEMPFTPAGAPSMRASTRWMMLSVQVVLAAGDEDLLPVEPVVVALRHGAGAHLRQIGAGLRLGEVHGAGPLPAHHLRQEALFLSLRAAISSACTPPIGQHRAQLEG